MNCSYCGCIIGNKNPTCTQCGAPNKYKKLFNKKENLNRLIEVVSLCNSRLNLTTEGLGMGKKYSFKNFGDIKRIPYSNLLLVMQNHSTFLEAGYFYILNSEVIKENGLEEIYSKILKKNEIEQVVSCDNNTSVDLYKIANERQKDIINRIISNKIANNEKIDFYIASEISEISGKNIIKNGLEIRKNRKVLIK